MIAGTFLCAFPFLLGDKSQYEGTWGDEGIYDHFDEWDESGWKRIKADEIRDRERPVQQEKTSPWLHLMLMVMMTIFFIYLNDHFNYHLNDDLDDLDDNLNPNLNYHYSQLRSRTTCVGGRSRRRIARFC